MSVSIFVNQRAKPSNKNKCDQVSSCHPGLPSVPCLVLVWVFSATANISSPEATTFSPTRAWASPRPILPFKPVIYLQNKAVPRTNNIPKTKLINTCKKYQLSFVFIPAQKGYRPNLCQRFHDKNTWHYRLTGKMPLKEGSLIVTFLGLLLFPRPLIPVTCLQVKRDNGGEEYFEFQGRQVFFHYKISL